MVLVILLLLCLFSAITAFLRPRFVRLKVNMLSQIFMLAILLICVLSPIFIPMPTTYRWGLFSFVGQHLAISLYYDPLTWIMLCFISFISLVIHSYAARYLLSDVNQSRFMGQLSVLTFSVMLLMMSGSLFTAFIAWQFIGVSLYLLLNHYHYDLRANKAAKKKFIINRIGDICFLLAVVIALHQYGNTGFETLFSHAAGLDPMVLLLITVAIMTKSAQFPFHLWLIDTMEAPTPVSALMHAGVINAGGFLLARLSPLYDHFSYLLLFIFVVGLVTAMLGSFFMQHQADVKKQLAYSTMGQMGYMLIQCGLGCFASAVFHLIVHGFFKATLFLSAGGALKQSNHCADAPLKQPASRLMIFIISLIISALLIVVGVGYFSMHHTVSLNPLLWLFVAISTFQVMRAALLRATNWPTACLSLFAVIVAFMAYLIILKHFTHLLTSSLAEQAMPMTGWIAIAVLLTIIGLSWLCVRYLPARYKIRLCYKLYLLGFEKGNIEKHYRHYLINPIRHLGDALLKRFCLMNVSAKALILVCIVLYFVISIIGCLPIQHDLSCLQCPIMLPFNLSVLLLILVIANRVKTLPQLTVTLALSVLAITSMAFAIDSQGMRIIGLFQCMNGVLIAAAFSLLLLKRHKAGTDLMLLDNRLPWGHVYMSFLLMLLIGVPGTASFISEFYLLYGLVHGQLMLALMFGAGMVLLALVVLHTLQVHFFNPNTMRQYAMPVGPWLHLMCLFVIGFNLFNGIFPTFLLRALSITIGG